MDSKKKTADHQRTEGPRTAHPLPTRRRVLQTLGLGAAAVLGYHGLSRLGSTHEPKPRSEQNRKYVQHRVNPRNGDKLPLLGYGGMRFPLVPGATASTAIDREATFALIDHALEHGVNFFDTAWMYHGGQSGVVLGNALKRHPRSSYFVSDKMPTSHNPTLAQAEKIFETQVANTHSDYIDYYLLHNLKTAEGYRRTYEENRVLDYLLRQKQAGRIRNLGFSFHGDRECLTYVLSRDVDWDIALIQLNCHDLMLEYQPGGFGLSSQAPPAEPAWVYERMLESGIPMLVMEPLLGGRLAKMNRKAVSVLQQERPESSAASWSFRYASSLTNVMTVLSGMTYLDHLQENIRTFSEYEPLNERELAVLRQALEIYTNPDTLPCTACGYCMPCPYAVDIPAVIFHYNDCVAEDNIPKGERSREYERARRAFLVGYDRSVPELRQAERCTGCDQCRDKCPQQIDIPAEMARIGTYAERLRDGRPL